MGVTCCVCGNTRGQGLSFHRIPKNEAMRQKWIEAIGKERWESRKKLKQQEALCSAHFDEQSFNRTYACAAQTRLKDDAIPTVFGYSSSDLNMTPRESLTTSQMRKTPATPCLEGDLSMEFTESYTPSANDRCYSLDSTLTSGDIVTTSQIRKTPTTPCLEGDLAMECTESDTPSTNDRFYSLDSTLTSGVIVTTSQIRTPDQYAQIPRIPPPELNVFPEDTPRRIALKRSLVKSSEKVDRYKKQLRTLKQSSKRMNETISSMKNVVSQLRVKNMMLEDQLQLLETLPSICLSAGARSTKRNSPVTPELRTFALTLNFLSPKAYNFVRKELNLALPHTRTLAKWYESVDGSPGFFKEALVALKAKRDDTGYPLICALIVDEMAIRQGIEWDGNEFVGYIDVGSNLTGDDRPLAKEVYVFLLTCVNANWKIPIGYFMVAGLNSEQRTSLVTQCLRWISSVDVRVVSITCDGPTYNWAMGRNLGCTFEPNNMMTSFTHPVKPEEKLSFIFDACHMLKLVRNCFGDKTVLYDGNGRKISWEFLVKLNEIQEAEGLHAGNKLKLANLMWKKQPMKVSLAVQLLSDSVADALEFCRSLGLNDFVGVEGTVHFIRIFNKLFDILNSRSIRQSGFKKAMNRQNYGDILDFFDIATDYIKKLKLENGQLVTDSPRKTGFLGFLVTMTSVRNIFDDLILGTNQLHYLPTYKLSQDHLEIFFGFLRSRGGFNNNPSCRQIRSSMKKILVVRELEMGKKGNCDGQELFKILTCSSRKLDAVQTINMSCIQGQKYWTEEDLGDFIGSRSDVPLEVHDYTRLGTLSGLLSEYSEEVVSYISGFVARQLLAKINCDVCATATVSNSSRAALINIKSRGGLITPSKDVHFICKQVEKRLRQEFAGNQLHKFTQKTWQSIVRDTLATLRDRDMFPALKEHNCDQPFETSHLINLMKATAECYLKVRTYYEERKFNRQLHKSAIRQSLTKTILFKGQ